ncbi:MAG: SCO6880 family protein [Acidimicrobiales bacterium]
MPSDGSPRYRLGPRSTRGLIAGWTTGQIICVAGGLVLGLGLMRSLGGGLGFVLGVLVTSAGFAVALWPVLGRTVEQWAPTVVAFGLRSVADGGHQPWSNRRRQPGPLSRLSLVSLDDVTKGASGSSGDAISPSSRDLSPPEAHSPGVVGDAEAGTLTAVLSVGGAGFALMDEQERAGRIADWSGLLAALAREGTGIHRLQWVFSTYPSGLDGPLSAGGGVGTVGEHYERLLSEAAPSLWEHEILVAVTVRRRLARHGRAEATSLLRTQLTSVSERLAAAGLVPGQALSTFALAARLKRSFKCEALDGMPAWPWPVGVENTWSRLRTDATWHVSYWVAEWPRAEVQGGWLLPLLFVAGVRATVSMTMAPLPPLAAVRRAERERTEGTADAELRRRHGFSVTARANREQEGRHQREAELAEGHAAYRFSGYVTVTEADPVALDEACGRVEQAAALAHLELRRLYGAQEVGFCTTLPVGRGCG